MTFTEILSYGKPLKIRVFHTGERVGFNGGLCVVESMDRSYDGVLTGYVVLTRDNVRFMGWSNHTDLKGTQRRADGSYESWENGISFVSDAAGAALQDEEGFATFTRVPL